MSARKASPDARRESDEEDLTIESSDDEYDPPPGSDDEYELDGFVVADTDIDESDGNPVGDVPHSLDVDASNILPTGSRRSRRTTQSIYDDPRFASEFAATLLTDVPQDELEVAIGESSDDEESPVPTARKRKRDCGAGDEDDDFQPIDEQSDSDIEAESDDDESL
jgi:hypothetical protein